MRFQLLDYCYGTASRLHSDGETLSTAVPEDVRVPPFDSLFEQRVFNRLLDRGYTVMPQIEAMGYRIDMVVTGAKGRLAIECDGDFWHGPEHYEADLARQRELERCGWEFHRIRESVFYADMPGTLQNLWDTLDELAIRTADWVDLRFDDDREVSDGQTTDEVIVLPGAEDPVDEEELEIDDVGERPTEHVSTLAPYVSFNESLPPVLETPLPALVANVIRIVEAEGPVLGHRLHDAYRIAYGGQRVGKEIARQLNRGIELAVKRGQIIADNPLGHAGVKPKTFRLPSQPEVLQRELGPRTLGLVPPAELASHLSESAEMGSYLEEELFREVLNVLGLKRLTEPARAVLSEALKLVPNTDLAEMEG
ncbi:hypothetical protein ACNQP7_30335 [Mycolicibacterium fortuitum]|uniref:hypothetical protein n=1 Tax=Mycolicibacterium fortuitum TaxID=1766 RepID=UPI003AAAED02